MKRELKFRCWDSEQKKFLYSNVDELRFDERGWSIGEYDLYSELKSGVLSNYDNALLQQFTGLKDRNGIEVYEGDIVKLLNGNRVFEYFKNSFWLIEPIERLFKFPIGLLSEDSARDMEIIGNIYENPELLKKEL